MKNFRVETTRQTFERIRDKLSRPDEPYYYVRMGDGDFSIILGGNSGQTDGSPELAVDLVNTFHVSGPGWDLGTIGHVNEPGMGPGVFGPQGLNSLLKWVEMHAPPGHVYANPIALHYYAVCKPAELHKLFKDLVQPRRKVFVGASTGAEALLGDIHKHIEVPRRNSYDTLDTWYPIVEDALSDGDLLILAAGMAARPTAARLYRAGARIQCIDLGSVINYALGEMSRGWIRATPTGQARILLEGESDETSTK